MIGLSKRLAITDPLLIQSVSSTLTVESRHDAFFRHLEGEAPNPAPFDTAISDVWAYNLALSFTVPGSCGTEIPLPILPTLMFPTQYQQTLPSHPFASLSRTLPR